MLYSMLFLVIHFMHSIYMYMCQLQSPSSSHLPFPPVSIHLFSTSVPVSALQIRLYHFSRFHIYALKYYIYLSLSDLPLCMTVSRSIHLSIMTQFYSFLWINNIPLYINTTSSLSIHLLMDFPIYFLIHFS